MVSLNRFENVLSISVLIIFDVCKDFRSCDDDFVSELEEDFEAFRYMV